MKFWLRKNTFFDNTSATFLCGVWMTMTNEDDSDYHEDEGQQKHNILVEV